MYKYFTRAVFLLLLSMLVTVSCKHEKTHQQLANYISSTGNGLIQQQTVSGINIKLAYRPSDFLVEQEMNALPIWDENKYRQAKNTYGKNLYFILSMSRNKNEVLNSLVTEGSRFSEMVNQLSFGMDEKVYLTTSANDTLPLVDFVYPRMYGMSGSTDIMFAFSKSKMGKQGKLYFKLLEFGLNTGNLLFEFNITDIEKCPGLIFEKRK